MPTQQYSHEGRAMGPGLGFVGAVSGLLGLAVVILDGIFLVFTPIETHALKVAPGVLFGLLVGGAIRRFQSLNGLVYLGFVVASTAAYALVYAVVVDEMRVSGLDFANARSRYDFGTTVILGAQSGFIGSVILTSFACVFLRYRPKFGGWSRTVIAGTSLGAILMPLALSIPILIGVALLLIGWPAGYAAALGIALLRAEQVDARPPPLADPPPP